MTDGKPENNKKNTPQDKIVEALFSKAIGLKTKNIHNEYLINKETSRLNIVKKKEVIQQYPPCMDAIKHWLKHKGSDGWQDDSSSEGELEAMSDKELFSLARRVAKELMDLEE